jgi:uncharacterized protein (TIGR03435 family)
MSSLHLVSDHLWQSTLFAAVVAVVVAMLRGKRASVRHALWLAASIKFVVPFAALTALGAFIGSRLSLHVPSPAPDFVQAMAAAPFVPQIAPALSIASSSTAAATSSVLLPAVIAVWAAGCALVLAAWIVRWMRAYRAVRSAAPYDTGREVAILRRLEASFSQHRLTVLLSDATIEPGVFGVWRPVLLWPRAMSAHLSDDQIETIFIHELSHVRRRDNLAAAGHMAVQAICWFHPLVWWIGARLVDERERACDEDVVRAGRDRRGYAESLLKTCQLSVGAPAAFIAGVTGSDLKRRLTTIIASPVGAHLGTSMRVILAAAVAAAIALPVVHGTSVATQGAGASLRLPDASKRFDAASIRPTAPDTSTRAFMWLFGDGNMRARGETLQSLLCHVFDLDESRVVGGPAWMSTDRFDIVAKSNAATPDTDLKTMAQNMLIGRFSLKVHLETRSLSVYALMLARADGRLGPNMRPVGDGSASTSRGNDVGPYAMTFTETMASLALGLTRSAGRPIIDRTGLDGVYEITMRGVPVGTQATDDPTQRAPDVFSTVRELGLKLEATRGPVEVLVIDSAEHPTNDDFAMPAQ